MHVDMNSTESIWCMQARAPVNKRFASGRYDSFVLFQKNPEGLESLCLVQLGESSALLPYGGWRPAAPGVTQHTLPVSWKGTGEVLEQFRS